MNFTGLITLQAISNGALKADALPTRLKLLNWGDNKSTKGNIRVGDKTLAALSANQKLLGFDKIGFDYEHQSVPGHKNFKPAPREYAAYGVPEVIKDDGLYITDITWTPSGDTNARNYIDLSPAVLSDGGEVSFIHSCTLCPQGAVEGLQFFSSDFDFKKITSHNAMNPDLKKLLCTLFGIPEDSTDEAILAGGKSFIEKTSAEQKPDAELKTLSASVQDLGKRFDETQRAGVLDTALREGKLVPNTAKELPLATLIALVAELPANMVPLDQRTPDNVQGHSATISALDLAVAKQLGLTPEEMK